MLNSITIENPGISMSIARSSRDRILLRFNSFLTRYLLFGKTLCSRFKAEIIEHPKWLQMNTEQLAAFLESPFENK